MRYRPHAFVAALASCPKLSHGRFSGRSEVRIVTGDAREPAAALQETLGLAQSVRGADDLKLVVVPRARRMIEVHQVIAETLAWSK